MNTQEHPFLVRDRTAEVDMVAWVAQAVEARDARIRQQQEHQNKLTLQQQNEAHNQQ